MQPVRQWQRIMLVATMLMLSVWLLGLVILMILAGGRQSAALRLNTLSMQHFGKLQSEPLQDGNDGICLQEVDGDIHLIDGEGRHAWELETPSRFRLLDVQTGAELHVLCADDGRAIAVDEAGEEQWRFEPVHHEMLVELRKQRSGSAVFYTMATALVYGLDERGVLQWVRQIPSASSIASQRPWMHIDADGNLITRSNSGFIRVAANGETVLMRSDRVWDTRKLSVDDNGRVMEFYGNVRLSTLDGREIARDKGLYAVEWDDNGGGAWLTDTGFAMLANGNYVRFSEDGSELRREQHSWRLAAVADLQGNQLLDWQGPGMYPIISDFPDTWLYLMRGNNADFSMPYPNDNNQGVQRLSLATEEVSLDVRRPAWLDAYSGAIHAFGDGLLLLLDEDGVDRVCRLEEL